MLLDLKRIRAAPVRSSPYPYFAVSGALADEASGEIAKAFPRVTGPGAIAVEKTIYGRPFEKLSAELRGDELRSLGEKKLGVSLGGAPILIEVRGKTRWTDGNIHTDTPSKLVTMLIYFNEPGTVDHTGLRILRGARDIEDFVEEISPVFGSMVAFKVTPNCWHGHKPFVGERHSLQLNYMSGVRTFGKHQLFHRLWSRTKCKLIRG